MSEGYQRRIWTVSKKLDRLALTCQQHHLQTKQREGLPEWKVPPSLPAGIASSAALKRDQMHRKTHHRQSDHSSSVPLYFAWSYDDSNRDRCQELRKESQSCMDQLQSSSQLMFHADKQSETLNDLDSNSERLPSAPLCEVEDSKPLEFRGKRYNEKLKEEEQNDRKGEHPKCEHDSKAPKALKSKIITVRPSRRKMEQCKLKSDEAYGVAKRLEEEFLDDLSSYQGHDTREARNEINVGLSGSSHDVLVDEDVKNKSYEMDASCDSVPAQYHRREFADLVEVTSQTHSALVGKVTRKNASTQTTAKCFCSKTQNISPSRTEDEPKRKIASKSMTIRRKPIQKKDNPIFLYQRYPPEPRRLCEQTTYKTSYSKQKQK
uniref:AlNc14C303G10396 protein n=1 Tax=Albugo laibachii Nc14 TaxID=890382 RepID=F0WVQ7_9STRA|nr:AlNc14C303G10396 [Albugo laibachii Nc14]|eukprot:CCA25503.1 AlNc14C303G10396 [Albugo laibachii Nc14]